MGSFACRCTDSAAAALIFLVAILDCVLTVALLSMPCFPPRSGKEVVIRKGKNNSGAILIGRMPIMLRSDRCAAHAVVLVQGWLAQWALAALSSGTYLAVR